MDAGVVSHVTNREVWFNMTTNTALDDGLAATRGGSKLRADHFVLGFAALAVGGLAAAVAFIVEMFLRR